MPANSPPPADDDPRWVAVLARDPAADGHFVYAVRSTGIYCRPSCPSRRPRPAQVCFFDDAAAAEASGFRPCRRCHPAAAPAHPDADPLVVALCRQIAAAEDAPTLATLGATAGLSPHQVHRRFRAAIGLTPQQFAQACRGERLRAALAAGQDVTTALHAAGYASAGHFHGEADRVLGMTASRYRSGGAGADVCFAVGECSLGAILVARSERGLCAIALGDDADTLVRELQDRFPAARLIGDDAAFAAQVAQVVALVEAPRVGLTLPLDLRGSTFQQRVWRALQTIPPGHTLSYTELAARIGAPRAVRAVASACAANTLAVAIPCHRVVRQDGSLSGYRWGVARKRELLARETSVRDESADEKT